MTKEQLKELGDLIASLPARPLSNSSEGQIRSSPMKGTGYEGYHVHSVCGGPMFETEAEKHHCIGSVIAKDEDTAARLARLIEAAPALLDEVVRLRAVLMSLSDDDAVEKAIEEAEDCGGDGVRCAVMTAQAVAREALGTK